MKIKCGDMYMVRLDHPSNLYAWSIHRIWWKPWRYNLHFYLMSGVRVNGIAELQDEVHRNLSLDGVKGMLKLFDLWKD